MLILKWHSSLLLIKRNNDIHILTNVSVSDAVEKMSTHWENYSKHNQASQFWVKMMDCCPKSVLCTCTHTLWIGRKKSNMAQVEKYSCTPFEMSHIPTEHNWHVGWTALFTCQKNKKWHFWCDGEIKMQIDWDERAFMLLWARYQNHAYSPCLDCFLLNPCLSP